MPRYGGRIVVGEREIVVGHDTLLDIAFLKANFPRGFMLTGPGGGPDDGVTLDLWVDSNAVLDPFEADPSLPPRLTEDQRDDLWNRAELIDDDGDILHVEALDRGVNLGAWTPR